MKRRTERLPTTTFQRSAAAYLARLLRGDLDEIEVTHQSFQEPVVLMTAARLRAKIRAASHRGKRKAEALANMKPWELE